LERGRGGERGEGWREGEEDSAAIRHGGGSTDLQNMIEGGREGEGEREGGGGRKGGREGGREGFYSVAASVNLVGQREKLRNA
jgi:hypothetical protein